MLIYFGFYSEMEWNKCIHFKRFIFQMFYCLFQNVTMLIGNPMDFARDIELLKTLKKSPVIVYCFLSNV